MFALLCRPCKYVGQTKTIKRFIWTRLVNLIQMQKCLLISDTELAVQKYLFETKENARDFNMLNDSWISFPKKRLGFLKFLCNTKKMQIHYSFINRLSLIFYVILKFWLSFNFVGRNFKLIYFKKQKKGEVFADI